MKLPALLLIFLFAAAAQSYSQERLSFGIPNCPPVSVEEHEKEKAEFKLYPNPADDVLNVELSESPDSRNCKLTVFSLNRTELFTQRCNPGSEQTLKVSQLPAGAYLLQVSRKNHTTRKMFFKL